MLCPITNRAKGYPYEVVLPQGCGVTGVVLADQVKNLDWRSRNAEFAGEVPASVVSDVLNKLATLLT